MKSWDNWTCRIDLVTELSFEFVLFHVIEVKVWCFASSLVNVIINDAEDLLLLISNFCLFYETLLAFTC